MYNFVYGIEVFVELKCIPTISGNENDLTQRKVLHSWAGANLDLTARGGIIAREARGEFFLGCGFVIRRLAYVHR